MSFLMFSKNIVMQCGFAFLECGSVRSKNATNILIKNILDSCMYYLLYFETKKREEKKLSEG